MRTTGLPSGEFVPVLGQGTWGMAAKRERRREEIRSLQRGLDLGMTLIDTAEMYGDGAAEELVGEAMQRRRADVFLVSKVLPNHATRRGALEACERSLRRLRTDRLDLYLLHWRESIPLEETIAAFDALVRAGKIRYWGVSNFDVPDLEELMAISGGRAVATNQVLYNLTRRGIEYAVLPRCRAGTIPIMAYSPVEQGRLLRHRGLRRVAETLGATPAQVALAWVLRHRDVIAIPKASRLEHVEENGAALQLQLGDAHLADLDREFPPPDEPTPLEVI
jgi:diketogulonate reductase-like aldo/keto reductase